MNKKILILLGVVLAISSLKTWAQDKGKVTGAFQYNQNFYQRDTVIGASGNPLYDKKLSGGEGWLNLQYTNSGFTVQTRLDVFNNSNLHQPTLPYSAQGLGIWTVSKELDKLTITGGYIYDQFGSGIVFRAYEDRGLGIDNAIYGIQLKYKMFNDKLYLKAFTGRQKNIFTTYEPIVKGINAESFFDIKGKVQVTPGLSVVNRTLDDENFNKVVAEITNMDVANRFIPKNNAYAYSVYNSTNWKNFTWYAEYAGKTNEAIRDYGGKLINKAGSVIFSTLNFSVEGFGITAQYKKTDYFKFRISPNENEVLLKGMVSFQPPLAKQNSLRLLARYSSATQELGEQAAQGDFFWTPTKGYRINGNYAHIDDGHGNFLFQEINADIEIKKIKKTTVELGMQALDYNLAIYQGHPGRPIVHAITPFSEITYKLSEKKSIRTELQYMFTKQDFGSWAYALVEFNMAPHYSFAVSDMYNTVVSNDNPHKQAHYYNFFVSYTEHSTRFTIAYVKQVAGVVCTGGVCRLEPAFSGLKMSVSTVF
ncbi:MAG: hypothetical protein RJA07_2078 [Bacteroidota bacterium]|jgi:hypothetical protein